MDVEPLNVTLPVELLAHGGIEPANADHFIIVLIHDVRELAYEFGIVAQDERMVA